MNSVLKNLVKACEAIVIAIFIFCLMGLLRYNIIANVDIKQSYEVDKNGLDYVGYDISGDRLIAQNNDPQIYFHTPEDMQINRVTVYFSEVPSGAIQLYYGGSESESVSLSHYAEECSFNIPSGNYSGMRIDIPGEFSIDKLVLSNAIVNYNRFYSVEKKPLIIVIAILVCFFALNIKFKWIGKIKSRLLPAFAELKSFKEKNKRSFIIRLAFLIAVPAYCLFVVATIWFYRPKLVGIFFCGTLIFYIIWLLDRLIIKKEVRPEKYFLTTSLIIGGILSCTLPLRTGISWDDEIHFEASSHIASVLLNNDAASVNEYTMAERNYVNLGGLDDYYSIFENNVIDDGTIIDHAEEKKNDSFNVYTNIAYIPVVFCTVLNRLIRIPFNSFIILSRFSNVFVYSMIIYLAIKKLKSGKYILSSIALIPICLFLASNYSYDYWVTALTLYSFAYFIGIMQTPDRKITYTDTLHIVISLFLACGPKGIYFPIGLIMFFVGKDRFESPKHRKFYYSLFVLTFLIIFAIVVAPILTNSDSIADVRGGENVDSGEQIKFILSDPLNYAVVLLKFLQVYFSVHLAENWIAQLGYISVYSEFTILSTSIIAFIIAFATFCDKNESDSFKERKVFKIVSLFIVFVILCVISTLMYIVYTYVGETTIKGVQWRYSVPVLFPFLYAIGSDKIVNKIKESYKCVVVYGGMAFASLHLIFWDYIMPVLNTLK